MWLEREEKGWGRREIFTAWHILRSPWLQIRVHRMCEPDQPTFYHGHPRPFLSIMLAGRYEEKRLIWSRMLQRYVERTQLWRYAGSIAWRVRKDVHYAWHPHGRASWSLVFFFGRKHPWEKVDIA
jgi:hypothetical protein